MEIVVVIWQVPLIWTSLEYDRRSNNVDPDDILYTTNAGDLKAVEEAIRIRDRVGRGKVTLLTAGPPQVESSLRECLSMGADAAIHIRSQTLDNHDTYGLCLILALAVKDMTYDLILCGEESLDRFGCVVYPGPHIAETLELPQITGVTSIEIEGKAQGVLAHRKIEHGDREIVRCPLPCLLAVDKAINEPRYPTFPNSIGAIRKDIHVLDAASLGYDTVGLDAFGHYENTVRFSPPTARVKKGLVIDTSLSATERMKIIQAGGLSVRDNRQELLIGEPDKQADEIISILIRRGFIRKLSK